MKKLALCLLISGASAWAQNPCETAAVNLVESLSEQQVGTVGKDVCGTKLASTFGNGQSFEIQALCMNFFKGAFVVTTQLSTNGKFCTIQSLNFEPGVTFGP